MQRASAHPNTALLLQTSKSDRTCEVHRIWQILVQPVLVDSRGCQELAHGLHQEEGQWSMQHAAHRRSKRAAAAMDGPPVEGTCMQAGTSCVRHVHAWAAFQDGERRGIVSQQVRAMHGPNRNHTCSHELREQKENAQTTVCEGVHARCPAAVRCLGLVPSEIITLSFSACSLQVTLRSGVMVGVPA